MRAALWSIRDHENVVLLCEIPLCLLLCAQKTDCLYKKVEAPCQGPLEVPSFSQMLSKLGEVKGSYIKSFVFSKTKKEFGVINIQQKEVS